MPLRPLLCAALVAAVAAAPRIAGDAALDLSSAGGAAAWGAASSAGDAVSAVRVPGDVLSALSEGGVIADPWLDLTWRGEAGRWDLAAWTFTGAFATPAWAAGGGGSTLLVLDSVKMAADVALNGHGLGAATSQHLRYTYDVTSLLRPPGGGDNVLNISFPPTVADARNDAGRFQGCSGGWCVRAHATAAGRGAESSCARGAATARWRRLASPKAHGSGAAGLGGHASDGSGSSSSSRSCAAGSVMRFGTRFTPPPPSPPPPAPSSLHRATSGAL